MRIQGSPDLHVDRGSTINLTCVISHRWISSLSDQSNANMISLINVTKSIWTCYPSARSRQRTSSGTTMMRWVSSENELNCENGNSSTRLCRTSLHVAGSLWSPRTGARHKAILSSGENHHSLSKTINCKTIPLLPVVRNARPSDSGNYTCKPSIFKTAAVRLHVLTGSTKMSLWTPVRLDLRFISLTLILCNSILTNITCVLHPKWFVV